MRDSSHSFAPVSEEKSPDTAGNDEAWNRPEFIGQLRRGDQGAYAELVTGLGPRMMVTACRLVSEEEARDVVQEAFIGVVKSIDRFEGRALLSTWIHRMVVNAALTVLRRRKRKPESSIDDLLPRFLEDGHRADPEGPWRSSEPDSYETVATRRLVRESIERLPASYREILILRDLEGIDTQETADLLGLSPANAKVRLHRARQALREALAPHMVEVAA